MDNNAKQQSAMKDPKNSVSKLVSLISENKNSINPTNKFVVKDHNGNSVELSKHSSRKSSDGRTASR